MRHNIHPTYSKYTVWHSLTYNEIIIVIKMISTSIKSLSCVIFPEERIAVGGVCSGDNLGMVLPSRHILRNGHFSFCHPFYFFLGRVSHKWLKSEVQVPQDQSLKLKHQTSLWPSTQAMWYKGVSMDLRLGDWISLISFAVWW